MKRLLAVPLCVCLVLASGCGPASATLTPDELVANWEKHKGQTVVLSGTAKILVPGKNVAMFYATDGKNRIMAEVVEGFENLKSGEPCRLSGKVKGLDNKTIVVEGCKVLP